MTEWREVRLADVSAQVDYGFTASAADDPDLPRFLRITDIVGSQIEWASVPGCVIDFDKFEKFALSEGDIVVARTGATVGYAKRIRRHPAAVFASYLVRFRLAPDVNPSYVGAVIESRAYKEYVLRHAGGAAQPNANAKVLGSFPFLLPDREVQRRVGAIFDAIDDLMENNLQRIEALEQMAQAVYREWVVRFRFPGHESTSRVDSPVGPLPEHWDVKPLDTLVVLDRTTVQPHRYPDAKFDHYSIPAFDNDQLPVSEYGRSIKSGKFLISHPAVLVSKLNPRIERSWLVEPHPLSRSVASTEFLVLRPFGEWSLEYLYLVARSTPFRERLQELSGGTSTSHQRAKPDDFMRLPVVVPPTELSARITEAVTAPLRLSHLLRVQGRRLAAMRQCLLPKLVTGQVDVLHLDLDALEASVA
jgi:type I restriction enzyme S subunit